MSEKPSGIWRRIFFRFILPALALFVGFLAIDWSSNAENFGTDWLPGAICAIAITAALWATFFFIRWLCCWRNFRKFLIGVGCFTVLVAAFYAEENWRGKHAWDNYRREWQAKGEKFYLKDFIPLPVPDEQNFALTPIVYSSYGRELDKHGNRIRPDNTNVVDRMKMDVHRKGGDYGSTNLQFGSWQNARLADLKPWQDYYRNPKTNAAQPNAVVTNEFPVSLQPQTPAADVLLALSKYDSVLEEVREAAKLPHSRFPVNYSEDNPFRILLPHLAVIIPVAQVLNLRAIAELEADQPEKALADLKLGFRCNEAIRSEPFLISHLVRIGVQSILMQSVWQGLAERKCSDAQIAELEAELSKVDYLADFQLSMRGERAINLTYIDYVRGKKSYTALLGVAMDEDESANKKPASPMEMLNAIGWYLIPNGWFYQAELTYAKMHEQWNFPAVDLQKRLVSPTTSTRLTEGFYKAIPKRRTSVENILVGLLFPALEKAAKKYAVIQSQVDLARIACALERYRLAHGEYPAALTALAPQLIAQVPHDLINGQPLQYHRTDDGRFVLYSVGWNEKDDGGEVVLRKGGFSVDTDQGDWVWRYPAK